MVAAATSLRLPDLGTGTAERLLGHLGRSPGLLVFDNLEDLPASELERLLQLLAELPMNFSKAVLTMRTAPEILYEHAWLELHTLARGLELEAAAAYVARRAEDHAVVALTGAPGGGAPSGLARRLAAALSGHPQMLQVAVGIAAREGLEALRRAVPEIDTDGSPPIQGAEPTLLEARMDALYGASVALHDAQGRRVLGLLTLFPDGSFRADELDVMARALTEGGAPGGLLRAAEGLAQSVAAALIESDGDVYRIHPTVQAFARRWCPPSVEDATIGTGALLGAAVVFVATHRDDHDALARRLGSLLGIFELPFLLEEVDEGVRRTVGAAVEVLGAFLLQRGHWGTLERWLLRLDALPEADLARRSHRRYLAGALHAHRGRIDDARAAFDEVLAFDEARGDRAGQAVILFELAKIERFRGNIAEARGLLRDAIRIWKELGDARGEAIPLFELGRIERSQGDLEAARARFQAILDSAGEDDRRLRSGVLYELASIARSRGDITLARAMLREVLQIDAELGDPHSRAATLQSLATVEEGLGDLVAARKLLDESVAILAELGDPEGRSAAMFRLASVEVRQGDPAAAREMLRQSAAIARDLGKRAALAGALHELAILEHGFGEIAASRKLLHESIAIARELGDREGLAASLHELAVITHGQGDAAGARELLEEAMRLADACGHRKGKAASLHQLGVIAWSQGDVARAEALLAESIRIKLEISNREGEAASRSQLAIIAQARGDLEGARRESEAVLRIHEELGNPEGRAGALHQLGRIEHAEGRAADAERRYREAIELWEGLGHRRGLAGSLHQLAILEANLGNTGEARALLRSALDLWEHLDNRHGLAGSLHQLAILEAEQDNLDEAEALLHASIQMKEATGERHGRAASLVMLGQVEAALGRSELAIEHLREGLTELESLGVGDIEVAREALRTVEAEVRAGVGCAD